MLGLKIWQGCEYARVTEGAEYAWIALNMSYVLICLNNAYYDWICVYVHTPEKHSAEYTRIQNVSDAVHVIKVNLQITEQLSRQTRIQNTVKHLRWIVLQK